MATEITQVLPAALRAKVEIGERGVDRPEREVAWFYRFLEIGDHIAAALAVGYEDGKAAAAGRRLKAKYAPHIREALVHVGQADLPLAAETLRRVMRSYDPDARIRVVKTMRNGDVLEYEDADPVKSSPAAAAAAVKAAESYLDRFGLPKGLKIEMDGQDTAESDFRSLIDRLVADEGLEAVRRFPTIMKNYEYRRYFEDKVAAGEYDGSAAVDITDESWETGVDSDLNTPVVNMPGEDSPDSPWAEGADAEPVLGGDGHLGERPPAASAGGEPDYI